MNLKTNSKLDVLLNRDESHLGGIRFPDTGNIVISGKYGQGKTTLAFQLASACAEQGGIAIYYSLENRAAEVLKNYTDMKYRSPNPTLAEGTHCQNLIQWGIKPGHVGATPADPKERQNLNDAISNTLDSKPPKTSETPRADRLIFVNTRNLAGLSERALHEEAQKMRQEYPIEFAASDDDEFVVFYAEILELLASIQPASHLDMVKMVVIDSLTEALPKELTRFAIHRLMAKFKEKQIVGVFLLEDRMDESHEAARFVNDVKYSADCVINLSASTCGGYEQTFIEVEKNRTTKHVFGKHVYKIMEFPAADKPKHIAKRLLNVFPSLYFEFSALPPSPRLIDATKATYTNLLGDPTFDGILPQSLTGGHFNGSSFPKKRAAQVLTLTGQSGLSKSDIAVNSLLYGLLDGQNGLIIRLNDNETFRTSGVRFNQHLWEQFAAKGILANNQMRFTEKRIKKEQAKSNAYQLKCWQVEGLKGVKLYEIIFAKGVIQPEEWLSSLMKIIKDKNIKRVALVDLKFIGVSYRFLNSSETAGDIFLPTFTQAMRVTQGVDLIYVASDGGIEESNREMPLRARNLSNASIFFKQGETNVQLSGTFDHTQLKSYPLQVQENNSEIFVCEGTVCSLHSLPMFSIG